MPCDPIKSRSGRAAANPLERPETLIDDTKLAAALQSTLAHRSMICMLISV